MPTPTSLPEVRLAEPTLAELRDNLIRITVTLADELTQHHDADRIQALTDLYRVTWQALADRDEQAAR